VRCIAIVGVRKQRFGCVQAEAQSEHARGEAAQDWGTSLHTISVIRNHRARKLLEAAERNLSGYNSRRLDGDWGGYRSECLVRRFASWDRPTSSNSRCFAEGVTPRSMLSPSVSLIGAMGRHNVCFCCRHSIRCGREADATIAWLSVSKRR
jgi:hypothetical protein